ncbi:glycosyltransferase family 2 protein [Chloroflexota bacterium]
MTAQNKIDLSIIIVNYNTRDLLLECLASIYRQADDLTLECIVVDNASADDSVAAVRQEFPQTVVIDRAENAYLAIANNQGVAAAQGRYVLALNPDTVIYGNALSQVVQQMDADPTIGAATTITYFTDGGVQPVCSHFVSYGYLLVNYTFLAKILRQRHQKLNKALWYEGWDRKSAREVDILPGYFILTTKELWEQAGGFPEDMLIYFTDDYISLRVQQLGKKNMYLMSDGLVHYEGAATRDGTTHEQKRYRPKSVRIYHSDMLVYTRRVYGRLAQLFFALMLIPTWLVLQWRGSRQAKS